MPPTKRKRRTKHRGNAAGAIEARGRTGRKPTAQESKTKGGRAVRQVRPPSWKSAFGKAAFGAVMLFLLMQLGVLGKNTSTTGNTIALCVFAMAAYTPVMYATDRFVYNRKQRQAAGGGGGGKR
jgi:hypothetical protein